MGVQQEVQSFPVVISENELFGVVALSDYQEALERKDSSLSAGDIGASDVVAANEEETFFSALHKITSGDFSVIPVVAEDDTKRIFGVISRRDLMTVLKRQFPQK